MRRGWIPRWLGYQLSKVGPLFFRWRGSPAVNAAFKVSVTLLLSSIQAPLACTSCVRSIVNHGQTPFQSIRD